MLSSYVSFISVVQGLHGRYCVIDSCPHRHRIVIYLADTFGNYATWPDHYFVGVTMRTCI